MDFARAPGTPAITGPPAKAISPAEAIEEDELPTIPLTLGPAECGRPSIPNPMSVEAPGIDTGPSLASKLNWTLPKRRQSASPVQAVPGITSQPAYRRARSRTDANVRCTRGFTGAANADSEIARSPRASCDLTCHTRVANIRREPHPRRSAPQPNPSFPGEVAC